MTHLGWTRSFGNVIGSRRLLAVFLFAVLGASFLLTTSPVAGATYNVMVSDSPDRADPVSLNGQTVSGDIYVFTSPDAGVSQVEFYLDDPSMSGDPAQTEELAPYDFAGTAPDGSAFPFNTLGIDNGGHTITAAITLTSGGQEVVTSAFQVRNEEPSFDILLSDSPDRADPVSLNGQTVSGDIYVFTSPDAGVSQWSSTWTTHPCPETRPRRNNWLPMTSQGPPPTAAPFPSIPLRSPTGVTRSAHDFNWIAAAL